MRVSTPIMAVHEPHAIERFVVGASNRVAVGAACAIAESPGADANPLVIIGGSGVGKTHLLKGIADMAQRLRPELKIAQLSFLEFGERAAAAIASAGEDAFVTEWNNLDVLLFDDVHAMDEHPAQRAFARIVSAALRDKRQVGVTTDRPIMELRDIEPRIVSAFGGAMTVELGPPDFETRLAYIKRIAADVGVDAHDPSLIEVARVEARSVRELRGVLNDLVSRRWLGVGSEVEDLASTRGLDIRPEERRSTIHEFKAYLAGDATDPAQTPESGRGRLAKAIAYWAGEGYRALPLERALADAKFVGAEPLIANFTRAVDQLRLLERRTAAVDSRLAGHPAFRDPERVEVAEDLARRAVEGLLPPGGPSPGFLRSAFEVSTSNRAAALGADAVIARPGVRHSPFVIHGPHGVGKTHLAHAIGNELIARAATPLIVSCVTAQRFASDFEQASDPTARERFRARYRAPDVLIFDDVQVLAGQSAAQDEFASLFDAYTAAGKQMIIVGDSPPRRLRGLDERLRSRIDGGLSAGIASPDRALRERLALIALERHAQMSDLALAQFFAEQPAASVRDLLASVHRVLAAASTKRMPLDVELARAELGSSTRVRPTGPSVQLVDPVFLDDEKIVWHWPDTSVRLIEDIR